MKKTAKVLLSLALCLCMVLSAGLTACGSNGNNSGNGGNKSHVCEHVCPECHKCLTDCEEVECVDKCQGHTPPHACEHVCPECHKCLTDCNEPECADKCQGHTPPHECEDICPECHKCLTDCNEPECADKCQGHTPPHACEHVCPECHKCLTDCKEPECEEKCEGHVVSTPISVAANSSYDMPISGISAGVKIIEADIGATKLTTGKLQARIGAEGTPSELVYSESRSTEGHNVYYGYIKISEGDTAITISTKLFIAPNNYVSEAVSGTVYIKDWDIPTLKADAVEVEIPMNIYSTEDSELLKIILDSSVTDGSYSFIVNCSVTFPGTFSFSTKLYFNTTVSSIIAKSHWGVTARSITASGLQTDSTNYCYLQISSSVADFQLIYPFTVKLTPAA